VDEPLYPPLATREALANALCHRDYAMGGGSVGLAVYDDRLEVTSTGSLHFGLTPDDLFDQHESRPWNPLIARTFYRRGIIEEWGRGTLKMAEAAISAGLPRPEIEDVGDCVTVRFRTPVDARAKLIAGETRLAGSAKIVSLNEHQRTILDLLIRAECPLALREIHARLPATMTVRQVRRATARLKALGLAETAGRGVSARWAPLQKP